VTDGYPSYVPAVREFECQHVIVNHTVGFINEDEFTTNKIENVRSHLKTMHRKRNGLNHSLISGFVEEFWFRKRLLQDKNSSTFQDAFCCFSVH
jgi:hypothetical protein